MNPPRTIALRLDGRPHEVAEGTTLADLVAALGHAPNAVTTAVGGCFVPREQRAERRLQSGDELLLFQPIVGG